MYGRHFVLKTDHKALSYMFSQQKLNHILADWLDVLLEYNFTVEHCPGVLMTLPDALSRCYPEAMFRGFGVQLAHLALQSELAKFPDRELVKLIRERFNRECTDEKERDALLEKYHISGHFGADLV